MPNRYIVNPQTGERMMLVNGQWMPAAPTKSGSSAAAMKPTEDQGKSRTYAGLMSTAEQQYDRAVKDGYNPGGPLNSFARAIEDNKYLGGMAPLIRDDKADRGRAAERLFQDAQLKAMTGAGQNAQEGRDNPRTYFPGFGEGPITAAQKKAARQAAFESAVVRAGPLGEAVPNPFRSAGQGAPAGQPKVRRFNPETGRIE